MAVDVTGERPGGVERGGAGGCEPRVGGEDAPGALTAAQIDKAQRSASAAGLYVESRPTGADVARLATATAAGIAVARGVLAMSVGLIRSETAQDLRTLTAVGHVEAPAALTAATAGSLAGAGAIIGTADTYLATAAWFHQELHWLADRPVINLIAILAGVPIVAYLGGWLLTGREPERSPASRWTDPERATVPPRSGRVRPSPISRRLGR